MIETPAEYEAVLEELRFMEAWLARLQTETAFDGKRLTKVGVRKVISRLQEELAFYEGGQVAARPVIA